MGKKQTYESAYEELKIIMEDLQQDKISVDELNSKVNRATELIVYCNTMLHDTEMKIADVINRFQEES